MPDNEAPLSSSKTAESIKETLMHGYKKVSQSKGKMQPADASRRADDKADIKKAMTLIKQCISDKRMPSAADLGTIRDLVTKHPNDDDFKGFLESAEKAFIAAQEAAAQELFNSTKGGTNPYTPEQYQDLLKKENTYFNDEKTQKRHKLIDKLMTGSHINDNDPAAIKEFTNFIKDVSSEETKTKRQESSELLAYDAGRIKGKQEAGIPLTNLETERKQQVHERIGKLTQEQLFESIFQKHTALYASEKDKKVEDITVEEVTKAKRNTIINEVIEIYPRIKQAFQGTEEKLAALLFHNPKAFHEHHNNIEQLQIEAEKAHQRQKEFERTKEAENKQELRQEANAKIDPIEKKVVTIEETVAEKSTKVEIIDNRVANKSKSDATISDKLAAMKAKKAAAAKVLELKTPVLEPASSSHISPNHTPPVSRSGQKLDGHSTAPAKKPDGHYI